MAGSEKRQRQHIIQARVNEQQFKLAKDLADAAGLSVSALVCFALYDQKPLRASRTPPMDRELAAQMMAGLGETAHALRQAAASGDTGRIDAATEAAQRDIAEMRNVLFTALGRTP